MQSTLEPSINSIPKKATMVPKFHFYLRTFFILVYLCYTCSNWYYFTSKKNAI